MDSALLLPKETEQPIRVIRRASFFGSNAVPERPKMIRRRGSTGRMLSQDDKDKSTSQPKMLRRRGSTGRMFGKNEDEQDSQPLRSLRRRGSTGRMFGKEEDQCKQSATPCRTPCRRGSTGRMFGKEERGDHNNPVPRNSRRSATSSRPRLRKASSQNELMNMFSRNSIDRSEADWLAEDSSSDFFQDLPNNHKSTSKEVLMEMSQDLNQAYNRKFQRKKLSQKPHELYRDYSTTKCPEKQQRLTRSNSEKLLALEEQVHDYQDTIQVIQKTTSRPFIQLDIVAKCA